MFYSSRSVARCVTASVALLCLTPVAHADVVQNDSSGTFFVDLLHNSTGLLALDPHVAQDTSAGTITLAPTQAAGFVVTSEVAPVSLRQWSEVRVHASINNVNDLAVTVLDCGTSPAPISGAFTNVHPNGGVIDIRAINAITYPCLSVRVDLADADGILPVLDDVTVKWTPLPVLLTRLTAKPSAPVGTAIVMNVSFSTSYVDATGAVLWVPLPHEQGTQTDGVSGQILSLGQNVDSVFVSASNGGVYNASATVIRGITIPANSVSWDINTSPAGASSTYQLTIASPNGTQTAVHYQVRSFYKAAVANLASSAPIDVALTAAPAARFGSHSANQTVALNNKLYAYVGGPYTGVVTYALNVQNAFAATGVETIFSPALSVDIAAALATLTAAKPGGCGLSTPTALMKITAPGGTINAGPQTVTYALDAMGPGGSASASINVDYSACFDAPEITAESHIDVVSTFSGANITPIIATDTVYFGVQPTAGGSFALGDRVWNDQIQANTDDNPGAAQAFGSQTTYLLAANNTGTATLNKILMIQPIADAVQFINASYSSGNGVIFYSTDTSFTDPMTPPPTDITALPNDLDAGSNIYWQRFDLTPPTIAADVKWVAFYVPCLASSTFPSPSGAICAGVSSSAIGAVTVRLPDVGEPGFAGSGQCSTFDVTESAHFYAYARSTSLANRDVDITDYPSVVAFYDTPELTHVVPRTPKSEANEFSIAGPATTRPFQQNTYNITLGNSGTDTALNVEISVAVPAVNIGGVSTPVTITGASGGTVVFELPTRVRYLFPAVQAGRSATASLSLTVPSGMLDGDPVRVNASATGSDDYSCATIARTASASTIMHGLPSVAARKKVAQAIVSAQGFLNYQFDVRSTGETAARDAFVVDKLPKRTSFVEAYTSGTDTLGQAYVCPGCRVFFARAGAPLPADASVLTPITAAEVQANFTLGVEDPPGRWLPPASFGVSTEVSFIAYALDDQTLTPHQLVTPSARTVGFLAKNDEDGPGPLTAGSTLGVLLPNTSLLSSRELLPAVMNTVRTVVFDQPGLALDAAVAPAVIAAGQTADFTSTYYNDGSTDDATATLTITVPPGSAIVDILHQFDPYTLTHHGSLPTGNVSILASANVNVTSNANGSKTVVVHISTPPSGGLLGAPVQFFEGGTVTVRVQANASLASGVTLEAATEGCYDNASTTLCVTDTAALLIQNPDLYLTKIADNLTPLPSETVNYVLALQNAGGTAAFGVTIADTLPAGLCFTGGSARAITPGWTFTTTDILTTNCLTQPTRVVFSVTSAAGSGIVPAYSGQILFTYATTVGAAVPPGTSLVNAAQVSTTSVEDPILSDTSTAPVMRPLPNAAVVATSPAVVERGSGFTVAISYSDESREAAAGVYIITALPDIDADNQPDVRFSSTHGDNGEQFFCHGGLSTPPAPAFDPTTPLSNGWVACTPGAVTFVATLVGGLPAQTGHAVQINVSANTPIGTPLAAGVTMPFRTEIFSAVDDTSGDNVSTPSTRTPSGDLAATIVGTPLAANEPSAEQSYRVRVKNVGTQLFCDLYVDVTLPAGFQGGAPADDFVTIAAVSADGSAVSLRDTAGNPTSASPAPTRSTVGPATRYTFGPSICLAAGTEVDFTLFGTIKSDVRDHTTLTATAVVGENSVATEDVLANNTATSRVEILRADLTVTLSGVSCGTDATCATVAFVDPLRTDRDAFVRYTVDVGSNGSIAARQAEVIDTIPDGSCYVVGSLTAPSGATLELSNDNAATFAYVSAITAGSVDCSITHWRMTFAKPIGATSLTQPKANAFQGAVDATDPFATSGLCAESEGTFYYDVMTLHASSNANAYVALGEEACSAGFQLVAYAIEGDGHPFDPAQPWQNCDDNSTFGNTFTYGACGTLTFNMFGSETIDVVIASRFSGGFLPRYDIRYLADPTVTVTVPVGTSAVPITPTPGPRFGHAMAYSPALQRTVLFGGYPNVEANPVGDTWEFDGETWKAITTAHAPPALAFATMWYDDNRGTIMLFGGEYYWQEAESGLYEYNGTDWTQLFIEGTPSGLTRSAWAYDTGRHALVLFGGFDGEGARTNATWEFVANNIWTLTNDGTDYAPSGNPLSSAVYDPGTGYVIYRDIDYDTIEWAYFGGAWYSLGFETFFAQSHDTWMVYDRARSRVAYQIADPDEATGEAQIWTLRYVDEGTIAWDRLTFTDPEHDGNPMPKLNAQAVYDAHLQKIVVYGGQWSGSGGGISSETWLSDGASWRLATAGPPGSYDPPPFSFNVRVRNSDLATSTITDRINGATVTPQITTTNDQAVSTLTVNTADTSVRVTLNRSVAQSPDDIAALVTTCNAGPDAARAVVTSIAIPTGLTVTNDAGCVLSGGAYECATGTLAAGACSSVTLHATVSGAVSANTRLTVAATLATPTYDAALTNNSAASSVTIANLANVYVTQMQPASAVLGGTATFALTYGNDGNIAAVNPSLAFTFGGGATFFSAAQTSGTVTTACIGAGSTVTCTPAAALPPGEIGAITVVLQIGTSAGLVVSGLDTISTASTTSIEANVSDNQDTGHLPLRLGDPGDIAGSVFIDADGDGRLDASSRPLPGIAVAIGGESISGALYGPSKSSAPALYTALWTPLLAQLLADSAAPPETTVAQLGDLPSYVVIEPAVSDAAGEFTFSAMPVGTYDLVAAPSARFAALGSDGGHLGLSNDDSPTPAAGHGLGTREGGNDARRISSIAIVSGEVSFFNTFSVRGGTVAGTLFDDSNYDGLRGGSEPALGATLVTLLHDSNGNGLVDVTDPAVGFTFTDASGGFSFDRLPLDDAGSGSFKYVVSVNDPTVAKMLERTPVTRRAFTLSVDVPDATLQPIGLAPVPDLVLTFGGVPFANPSAVVTYFAVLTNAGHADAAAPTVTVTLDANFAALFVVFRIGAQTVVCPVTGQTATCTSPVGIVLGPGERATIDVVGTVSGSVGAGASLTQTVAAATTTPEKDLTSNTVTTHTAITLAPLNGISGAVTLDLDNDGVRDSEEPGIAAVPVALAGFDNTHIYGPDKALEPAFYAQLIGQLLPVMQTAGIALGSDTTESISAKTNYVVVATVATDINGSYGFVNLGDGTYAIAVKPPLGALSTQSDAGGTLGTLPNDSASADPTTAHGVGHVENAAVATTLITAISVSAGQASYSNDFGILAGSISGIVYDDTDNNNLFGATALGGRAERGFANLTVSFVADADNDGIFDPGEQVLGSTLTAGGGGDGHYTFSRAPLDGTTHVLAVVTGPSSFLSAHTRTGPTTSPTFSAGAPTAVVNLGYFAGYATISGAVPGNAGVPVAIAGIDVYGRVFGPSPTLDAALFMRLMTGLQTRLVSASAIPGTGDFSTELATLAGSARYGIIAPIATSGAGDYTFSALFDGTYDLLTGVAAGHGLGHSDAGQLGATADDSATPSPGHGTGSKEDATIAKDMITHLQIGPRQTSQGNIFTMRLGTVTGVIYADVDGDGLQGAGEGGYGQVTVVAFADTNGNGVADPGETIYDSTVTDGTGAYTLNVPVGTAVTVATQVPPMTGFAPSTMIMTVTATLANLDVTTPGIGYVDNTDTDGDGLRDTIDADDDGDGIPDTLEAAGRDPNADPDHNGVPAWKDPSAPGFIDSNHDGVDDRFDLDLDGIPNQRDLDSDNDGIDDSVEAQATYRAASGMDTDHDGLDDAYDADNGGIALIPLNTDGADLPDFLDLDSDNDGLSDRVESGFGSTPSGTDADKDGIDAAWDSDDGRRGPLGRVPAAAYRLVATPPPSSGDHPAPNGDDHPAPLTDDRDGDGVVDARDNCPDTANADQADKDGDGLGDACDVDANNDGVVDNIVLSGGGFGCTGAPSSTLVPWLLAIGFLLRRRSRHAAALALLLVTTPAFAQTFNEPKNFPVERYHTALNRQGIIDTEWGRVLDHLAWDMGLVLDYARNPLVFSRASDRTRIGALVENRLDASIVATIGLLQWIELGFELPVVLYQSRPTLQPALTSPIAQLQSTGFGDLRLVPRVRILRSDRQGIDLAVLLNLTLPTGGAREYLGEGSATFAPELVISRAWTGWRLAANVGVVLRRFSGIVDLVTGNEMVARIAAGYRFKDIGKAPFEVDVGVYGAFALAAPFRSSNQTAIEIKAQASYEVTPKFLVFLGGGMGILRGWGVPDFRVFFGTRFGDTGKPPAPAEPMCPRLIECVCARPASAPTCAPPPLVAQVEPAPEAVAAPVAAAPDRDGDGVPDAVDNCPDQAGLPENDGCSSKQRVRIKEGRLELVENVVFGSGNPIIQTVSFPVLDNVAEVLRAHPEIAFVEVQGHSDDKGDDNYNLRLSQARSEAVRKYLIAHTVAAARLGAKGYGETQPIAPNDSDEGRAKNRRVEFIFRAPASPAL